MKVDFEDRKYWKTQKCNNLIKPVDFLVQSTPDVLCNFVFIFRQDDAWSNWMVELVKLGGNPLRLCLVELVELGGNPLRLWPPNLNEFLPKSTSIYLNEFTPKSTSIYLNGFTPNLTGQIRLGINYWSNWVEIHWDYIVCLPGRIGYHLSGFTPNLRGVQILSPSRIRPAKLGVNPLRLWPPNSTRHTM